MSREIIVKEWHDDKGLIHRREIGQELVRCGECKYCVNDQCWKSDGLDKLDGNVDDDDFCSRGEREGE